MAILFYNSYIYKTKYGKNIWTNPNNKNYKLESDKLHMVSSFQWVGNFLIWCTAVIPHKWVGEDFEVDFCRSNNRYLTIDPSLFLPWMCR